MKSDVDKAEWFESMSGFGLVVPNDPLGFQHRALVSRDGADWRVAAWQIHIRTPRSGDTRRGMWVEIGVYPTLRGAQIKARQMARLFDGMSRGEKNE